MGSAKFYAVRSGHKPGLYTTWDDCLSQVKGFKGATFKSFPTESDAKLYLSGHDPSLNPSSSSYTPKFYGVKIGKTPGVYTSWAETKKQVVGTPKPKFRAFATREQAEAFVNGTDVPEGAEGSKSAAGEKEKKGKKRKSLADNSELGSPDSPTPGTGIGTERSREEMKVSKLLISLDSNTEPPPAKKTQREGGTPRLSITVLTHTRTESTESPPDATPTPRSSMTPHSPITPAPSAVPLGTLLSPSPTSTPASSKPPPVLRIYTDGSARSNGKASSSAGVGVYFGASDPRNISEPLPGPRQTNNRAELTAVLRALEIAPKHREVLIFTDSQYSINCITVWSQNWERNGWRSAGGKAVENRDLVERILEIIRERLRRGVKTGFEWVKGHAGGEGNEEADRLANEGAMKQRAERGGG